MATPEHIILESAGGELVTNGFLATDITGWTDASDGPGSISWSAGTMRLYAGASAPTGTAKARQTLTTVIGVEYTFSFEIVSGTGEAIAVYLGTTLGGLDVANHSYSSNNTHTFTFTATATTTYLQIWTSAAFTVPDKYIDNISCRPTAVETAYIDLEDDSGHVILESSTTGSHTAVVTDGEFIFILYRRRRR